MIYYIFNSQYSHPRTMDSFYRMPCECFSNCYRKENHSLSQNRTARYGFTRLSGNVHWIITPNYLSLIKFQLFIINKFPHYSCCKFSVVAIEKVDTWDHSPNTSKWTSETVCEEYLVPYVYYDTGKHWYFISLIIGMLENIKNNRFPKQRVPVAPQNSDLSPQKFFKKITKKTKQKKHQICYGNSIYHRLTTKKMCWFVCE